MNLTFSSEKLLKTAEVDELAFVGHLSQLVEDIKLFQVISLLFYNIIFKSAKYSCGIVVFN